MGGSCAGLGFVASARDGLTGTTIAAHHSEGGWQAIWIGCTALGLDVRQCAACHRSSARFALYYCPPGAQAVLRVSSAISPMTSIPLRLCSHALFLFLSCRHSFWYRSFCKLCSHGAVHTCRACVAPASCCGLQLRRHWAPFGCLQAGVLTAHLCLSDKKAP